MTETLRMGLMMGHIDGFLRMNLQQIIQCARAQGNTLEDTTHALVHGNDGGRLVTVLHDEKGAMVYGNRPREDYLSALQEMERAVHDYMRRCGPYTLIADHGNIFPVRNEFLKYGCELESPKA